MTLTLTLVIWYISWNCLVTSYFWINAPLLPVYYTKMYLIGLRVVISNYNYHFIPFMVKIMIDTYVWLAHFAHIWVLPAAIFKSQITVTGRLGKFFSWQIWISHTQNRLKHSLLYIRTILNLLRKSNKLLKHFIQPCDFYLFFTKVGLWLVLYLKKQFGLRAIYGQRGPLVRIRTKFWKEYFFPPKTMYLRP